MKKSLKITVGALALGVVCATVWAFSVSYITTSASFTTVTASVPPAGSGSVANITSTVHPGDTIPFSVTFGVTNVGGPPGTTYNKSVTFNAATTAKPALASDVGIVGMPKTHLFTSAASSFLDAVTLTAPATVGAYTVRIGGASLTTGLGSGGTALGAGTGLTVNFSVTQPCLPANTQISVPQICVLLHQTTPVDLTATLMDDSNNLLSGQTLHFSVDGNAVGDAVTNGSGVATISNYDVSGLSVGDHEVFVAFDGVACPTVPAYNASNGEGNIGVTYLFIGFQQPINADGSSIFKGATIPVKIRISDANGQPITDAEAHVFFSMDIEAIVGDDAEPLANTNADSGNLMRYDPVADQYIFNWDITTVSPNGTWKVWVDLGEGSCGEQHGVLVGIQKVGKGVKK